MTKENVKYMIDLMPDEKFNEFAAKIVAFFPIDEELIEEREDEELARLAGERIDSYGGWEEAEQHCISSEEFWSSLGVTAEDIENAEEDELI